MATPRIHALADAVTQTGRPEWNGNFRATSQGNSQVCRVGNVVSVVINAEATKQSPWGGRIATLPSSFRPSSTLIVPLTGINGSVVAHGYFYSDGRVTHTGTFNSGAVVTTVATFQAS